jgi:hypothetical protein
MFIASSPVVLHKTEHTERIRDSDKLNLVKFPYIGLVLDERQFLILPQLPQIVMLNSKVVKTDSKKII